MSKPIEVSAATFALMRKIAGAGRAGLGVQRDTGVRAITQAAKQGLAVQTGGLLRLTKKGREFMSRQAAKGRDEEE